MITCEPLVLYSLFFDDVEILPVGSEPSDVLTWKSVQGHGVTHHDTAILTRRIATSPVHSGKTTVHNAHTKG